MIRQGESGISSTAPPQMTAAGTIMLPVPRSTLANAFMIQSRIAPA